jgi:ribosome-associated toxin RatA of RatAB toxin-antitoxin module
MAITGRASTDIDAPIERCWEVVEDVPTAPEWQGGLERMDVIERDEHGRAVLCDALSDAKVRKVMTRTRFTYEAPNRLAWTQEGKGDLKSMRGAWELEDLGDGRTRATYDLEVDLGRLGFIIRGPIVDAVRAVLVNPRPKELAARVSSGS